MNRRQLCMMLPTFTVGSLSGRIGTRGALAQAPRELEFQLLGFVLAIQVPAMAAVLEILPAMPGYGPTKFTRINQNRVVAQVMVSGNADIGDTDPPVVVSAIEAGGQLKMVGKLYDKTSLVLVGNADRVRTIADLAKPETRVAIGARGEITHVMLVQALLRHNQPTDQMTLIEMPGSGPRVTALLSGRIDAANLHFDQVESIASRGNFRVLIEPWKEFGAWANEVWVVRKAWLEEPRNRRALVDVLKANLTAFRRANTDFDWYLAMYRKYCSQPNAAQETAANLRPIWDKLRTEIRAWPNDMNFSMEEIRDLLPAYRASDAIAGTVRAEDIVDASFLRQALSEMTS